MTEETSKGGLGKTLRPILLTVVAVIAAVYALKLGVWLLKMALLVAAVGTLGYVGLSRMRGRVGTDSPPAGRLELEHEASVDTNETPADDPIADIEQALRDLKEREGL